MADQKLKIRLPNAREKLQALFPFDNRGDINIIFGKRTFKLQKAFLRLESAYFKQAFILGGDSLEIKQNFNVFVFPMKQQHFSNVLRCFYGYTIEVARTEIIDYYPIIKFLMVQSLLKLVREDMINRPQSYEVFILLQIAHRFSEQDLFQLGLAQLEKEGYEQLRYNKHELLKCPMELFKIIVKTHNRLKSEQGRGIPIIDIDSLIKDYSDEQKLSEAQYQELKFQLIDKRSLNSQEYKQIFLDDAKRKRNSNQYRSMIKLQPDSSTLYNSAFNSNLLSAGKLTESVIEPMKKISDQLTLQLQNTYEKKKNEELQAENAYLTNELNDLRAKSVEHSSSIDSLKELISRLQARLEEKDKIDKEQSSIIKRLEKMCIDLKNQINARNDLIKKLEDRLLKLEKNPQKRQGGNPKYLPYDEEEEESKTIQSQIVPGHLLKELASKPVSEPSKSNPGFKKSKNMAVVPAAVNIEEDLDEDELEEMYSSRLEFDSEPVGCNKCFLPKLANFLTTDGFQKKKLALLFRRNSTNKQAVGQPSDIYNKKSLIVLICTKLDQIIGGFTSVQISKNFNGYLSDENSFLFTLSKNEKFSIRKSHMGEAIFVSSDYIIGFSNDLMISVDCMKVQCDCSWPEAYENNGEKRNGKWLTGQEGSFNIKTIQIYEVKEEEMIMDL